MFLNVETHIILIFIHGKEQGAGSKKANTKCDDVSLLGPQSTYFTKHYLA